MPANFGPPPGCTCDNYYELNGTPVHEDGCLYPDVQDEEVFEEWAYAQRAEELDELSTYDDSDELRWEECMDDMEKEKPREHGRVRKDDQDG